jgi:hypothetical protein
MPSFMTQHHAAFGLGSTKQEVLSAQGSPKGITPEFHGGETWDYGFTSRGFLRCLIGRDTVEFDSKGKVIAYTNHGGKLRIELFGKRLKKLAGSHFTIGSTMEEVFAAQGTPDGIDYFSCVNTYLWSYFTKMEYVHHTVYFDPRGLVSSVENSCERLNFAVEASIQAA